jgi:amino acid adenylation domain-containing protein
MPTMPLNCIHEVFEQQVDGSPGAVALEYEDQQLTFRELDERANRLSHHLMKLGVHPEVVVGLCVERSFEMIVGMLAILKAGGAYLPLDPSYPQDRLAYMVRDTGVRFVLTHGRHGGALAACSTHIIDLNDDPAIANQPSYRPQSRTDPDYLAYFMYTSGSTGKPKAVGIMHRGVTELARNERLLRAVPGDGFLQLATPNFDAATWEIWTPLLSGARLVLFPPGPIDLLRVKSVIEKAGINVLFMTTGLFNRAVDEVPSLFLPLRKMLTGGEALSGSHAQKFFAVIRHCTLINCYGPTECTVIATCFPIEALDLVETSPSIGRPIANVEAYVVDDKFDPVPDGTPGELLIGGAGLGRGYFNHPEMTAEVFIPNPFGLAGSHLYRTGDLVRCAGDGTLEFLGRIDNQIKVRGYRVEPGEIESALLAIPGIRQALVTVRPGPTGDKRLVAYLLIEGRGPDTDSLRKLLAGMLPDFMVPSAFLILSEFPLSPSGKVDLRALPEPEWKLSSNPAHESPQTPVERAIANIWEEILGVHNIGLHDNFFDLGGTSLVLISMITRISSRFSVRPSASMAKEGITVARLAEMVSQLHQSLETVERQAG